MAISVTHTFVSPVADYADPNEVGPDEWNAAHTLTGFGTGVETALAVAVGSAGSFVVNGGALGTPSSGTLTSCTGLPVSTGISGLGTGVATALAVNTGSAGAFVLFDGALGTPSSGTVTNLTGTASININGTVGATTPTTGAFTSLAYSTTLTGTSTNASALAVGANGATNPVLKVDASTASVATGLSIVGAAAASRVAVAAISSGTDEGLSIDAKGAGTIRLGATSTGAIEFSRNLVPTASDGAALGTSSLMFSDAFLASGSVINFNNGDVTLTHSSNTLTLGGSTLASLTLAVSGTAASSSTTTGALTVAGGIGANETSYFKTFVVPTSGSAPLFQSFAGTSAGFWFSDVVNTTSQRIFFGADAAAPDCFRIYSAVGGNIFFVDGVNVVANLSAGATGKAGIGLAVYSSTPTATLQVAGAGTAATSTTSANIVTSGGIGVAGGAFFGAAINVNNGAATSSGLTTTLNIVHSGTAAGDGGSIDFRWNGSGAGSQLGARIGLNPTGASAGDLLLQTGNGGTPATRVTVAAGGDVTLSSTTAPTSNTTGALIVAGGAGIAKDLYVATGTTAIAPLRFTSGTNLTTAAAGACEYDGKVFYATSVASSRQVVATQQFVTVQGSAVALSNSSTSPQAIFAAANDVISLAASTTYYFEGVFYFTTGSTSHTTAIGLVASSAFTSIQYWASIHSGTTNIAPTNSIVTASTATVLNTASTATSTAVRISGIVRTNAASTLTPQVTFSAGPTGTCQTEINSYFYIWPIGSNTVAAVGNWG